MAELNGMRVDITPERLVIYRKRPDTPKPTLYGGQDGPALRGKIRHAPHYHCERGDAWHTMDECGLFERYEVDDETDVMVHYPPVATLPNGQTFRVEGLPPRFNIGVRLEDQSVPIMVAVKLLGEQKPDA